MRIIFVVGSEKVGKVELRDEIFQVVDLDRTGRHISSHPRSYDISAEVSAAVRALYEGNRDLRTVFEDYARRWDVKLSGKWEEVDLLRGALVTMYGVPLWGTKQANGDMDVGRAWVREHAQVTGRERDAVTCFDTIRVRKALAEARPTTYLGRWDTLAEFRVGSDFSQLTMANPGESVTRRDSPLGVLKRIGHLRAAFEELKMVSGLGDSTIGTLVEGTCQDKLAKIMGPEGLGDKLVKAIGAQCCWSSSVNQHCGVIRRAKLGLRTSPWRWVGKTLEEDGKPEDIVLNVGQHIMGGAGEEHFLYRSTMPREDSVRADALRLGMKTDWMCGGMLISAEGGVTYDWANEGRVMAASMCGR